MKLSKSLLLAVPLFLSASGKSAVADDITVTGPLHGYQCMMLTNLWDGVGPMPPPTQVFAGPAPNAAPVGIAGGSVIVPDPIKPIKGRTPMIFANGRKVWINVEDIRPWHAVSNPHATCTPALLSNGRYGFDTKH